jgi:hypothetical protein
VSQALTRVRQAERRRKKERFTALFHPLTVDLLDAAFADLDEDAAAGADDIIVGFVRDDGARRFWDAMRERLGQVCAVASSGQDRLIEFGRCAAANRARRGLGKPETFAFLWDRSCAAGSTTTPRRPTAERSAPSASSSPTSGGKRSRGAARGTA